MGKPGATSGNPLTPLVEVTIVKRATEVMLPPSVSWRTVKALHHVPVVLLWWRPHLR